MTSQQYTPGSVNSADASSSHSTSAANGPLVTSGDDVQVADKFPPSGRFKIASVVQLPSTPATPVIDTVSVGSLTGACCTPVRLEVVTNV